MPTNDSGKHPGDPQGIVTFSDGNTFWTGLPLLSMCLTDEFAKRYYEKDYSKEQREKMAGLIGRLLAAGFYDGPALCALSLFRETFGLALLSSSQTSEATARIIKTIPADNPHLSSLGELALQSGTITDFPPTGYSSLRWSFWVQPLTELARCGIKSIEYTAKSCLAGMKWAGDGTELLPKLISEELTTREEEED
ncbi:hypothetical protein V2G26_014380 [Clonostachys chloroleuca]